MSIQIVIWELLEVADNTQYILLRKEYFMSGCVFEEMVLRRVVVTRWLDAYIAIFQSYNFIP